MQVDPALAPAHHNLGMVLQRQGKTAEAISEFRRVLELRPDYVAARYLLSNALETRGETGEAIVHYRKILEMEPNHAEVHNNLAWLLATGPEPSLRNAAEAIEHAQRADQLSGGRQPTVLDTLAAAYAEAGRFPEALTTARKALELATQQHNKTLMDTMQARIALYEAGRPFHRTKSSQTGRP